MTPVKPLFACLGALLLAASAPAQLVLPVADVALANPTAPALTIQLGATSRAILPTPFVLGGSPELGRSALWFCMDPLQTIFYNHSAEPVGAFMNYASDDPSSYDKWTSLAPGLSTARKQTLADLFLAYTPSRTDRLLASALQLVVPEITNEFDGYGFSLSTGKFRASGSSNAAQSVVSLAQSILESLGTPAVRNHGTVDSLHFLIDGTYTRGRNSVAVQDLVGFIPVPEPATYGLAAGGATLAFIGWQLRRRRTARTGGAQSIDQRFASER